MSDDASDPQAGSATASDPLVQSVNAAIAHESEKKALMLQIEDLSQQIQTYKESAARAQAELQNAKIRMERELKDTRTFATHMFIMRLLPIIDNLDRATMHLPPELEGSEWTKGVLSIASQLQKELSDAGVSVVPALGQPADAHKHDVIMDGPGEKGIITDVFEQGYALHGKILRPAKVKVGNGESDTKAKNKAA